MGFVYFLREGTSDRFKIGCTANDVKSRLASLQTGNSQTLTLYDEIECDEGKEGNLESWFHRILSSHRIIGGGTEWFEVDELTLDQFILKGRNTHGKARKTRRNRTDGEAQRHYADYVRQVSRGQQDTTPSGGKVVLPPWDTATLHARSESIIVSECEELDVGRQTDRGTLVHQLGERLTGICGD